MIPIKYIGSKSRIAKDIVPIIQSYIDDINAKFYLEPFVGGANIIDKINCSKKIGCDINHYLIEMFKHLDLISSLSTDITQEEYNAVRQSWHNKDNTYPDWYIGAVGFLASYNGKFFGGRSGIRQGKDGKIRNYYDECKRNLLKQIPFLIDIDFYECDYQSLDMSLFKHGVIYCDIPYQYTTGYQHIFNHDQFWEWASKASKDNIVLVSEQTAPTSWKSIWSKEIKRTLNYRNKFNIIEHLYIYNPIY